MSMCEGLCIELCCLHLPFPPWFVLSYSTNSSLVITIQDATGFVCADDVTALLANFSTANVNFLPAQRYGNLSTVRCVNTLVTILTPPAFWSLLSLCLCI